MFPPVSNRKIVPLGAITTRTTLSPHVVTKPVTKPVSKPNSKSSSKPKKIGHHFCLFLDLDQTLISAIPTTPKQEQFNVTFRPYLQQFLNFCFDTFGKVVLFSAGQDFYVEAIADLIFTRFKRKFDAILSYNHCIKVEGKVIKDIKSYCDKFGFNNAVLLDDLEMHYDFNMDMYEGEDSNNNIWFCIINPFHGSSVDKELLKSMVKLKSIVMETK